MKCFGIFLQSLLVIVVLVSWLGIVNADCNYAGQTFQRPGECTLYTCREDGSYSSKTCAIAALTPGCKIIPADYSKSYPDCCEKYEC